MGTRRLALLTNNVAFTILDVNIRAHYCEAESEYTESHNTLDVGVNFHKWCTAELGCTKDIQYVLKLRVL